MLALITVICCENRHKTWGGVQIQLFCRKFKDTDIGVALCSLFIIILCAAPCSGQEADIESVIPAYSVAYVAVTDIPGIWDSFKASPSWQSLLHVPAGVEIVMDGATELLGVDMQTLTGVFGRRIALVQVFFDIIDGPPPPVIIADVRDPEDAAEVVRKIEQFLGSSNEYEVRSPAGEYKTVPFSSIRASEGELTIRYTFLDNLFVLAMGQDTFEAILDVYLGEDPPLMYDPGFNKTRSGVYADGEVFVYLNMELLWPIVRMVWDSDLAMLLQMLGVDEIKSVAWTTGLSGANRDQEMYMYTGDSQALFTSLLAQRGPLLSLHLVPISDTDVFLAMNLGDPTAAWGNLMESARSVMDEEDYSQMQDNFAAFERETALSLKDDMLSTLTGEIGLAMSMPETIHGVPANDYIFFCGVRDNELLTMSMERILSEGGNQLQRMEYKGVAVYGIPTMGYSGRPVGYMFADELLIFSGLRTLERIIDEEPPLVVSRKFSQVSSQLPQPPGLMCYIDLEKVGERLLMADPNVQPEDDLMRLKMLGAIGAMLLHDGEGIRVKLAGTSAESWLKTIGDLAELFVGMSF